MKRWPIMLACWMGIFLTGCNREPQTVESQKWQIGFVMKVLNNPFFIRMEEGARQAARELNVELIVQAADREIDVERQMQIIENLIEARVSALCVTPSGSREVVAAIAKANGCRLSIVESPKEAAEGADIVYTDVWVSMGQEEEQRMREKVFRPYQVNAELLAGAFELFLGPLLFRYVLVRDDDPPLFELVSDSRCPHPAEDVLAVLAAAGKLVDKGALSLERGIKITCDLLRFPGIAVEDPYALADQLLAAPAEGSLDGVVGKDDPPVVKPDDCLGDGVEDGRFQSCQLLEPFFGYVVFHRAYGSIEVIGLAVNDQ